MGETALTPSAVPAQEQADTKNYLIKENYLSEFETEDEKSVARANLGVYAQSVVYTQDEAQLMMNEKIHAALQNYVTSDELPQAIAELSQQIADAGYVKSDGSVPFTNPQTQAALPTNPSHLTNKAYVDNLLTKHLNANDPHKTLDAVKVLLTDYVKLSETYTSQNLYSKKEVDKLLEKFVKRDGSTGFINPQVGVDPSLPSHLATMRYVLLVMQNHKSEADPHDFIKTLRRFLSNYYTKSETYTKAQTYSRSQLLDIIKSQMNDIIKQAIAQHVAEDGSVNDLENWIRKNYVPSDGSVPFTAAQSGVKATQNSQFVILEQLNQAIEQLKAETETSIKESTDQTDWIPTGPVETTVGFVEEGTTLPKRLTVQQIMDAIFYEKQTGVIAPEYAEYGEEVCIKIYAHGLQVLTGIDIYKNGTMIGSLTPNDFTKDALGGNSGYYEYCDTGEFTEDTEWKVIFHYAESQDITETAMTKLTYPIFVGAVPYWWNAQEDITMESLRRLAEEEPEANYIITDQGPEISSVSKSIQFTDTRQRSIVIAVPNDYPDLKSLKTPAQEVTADAFAKWIQPMYPNQAEVGVLYKIYVFNQPLVNLQQTIDIEFEQTKTEEP